MCHPRSHMRSHHRMLGACECGPFLRHFLSEEEKLEMLENYKEHLEKELAGVKEHIRELSTE